MPHTTPCFIWYAWSFCFSTVSVLFLINPTNSNFAFAIFRLTLRTLTMRGFPTLRMCRAMRLWWAREMFSTSPCTGRSCFTLFYLVLCVWWDPMYSTVCIGKSRSVPRLKIDWFWCCFLTEDSVAAMSTLLHCGTRLVSLTCRWHCKWSDKSALFSFHG